MAECPIARKGDLQKGRFKKGATVQFKNGTRAKVVFSRGALRYRITAPPPNAAAYLQKIRRKKCTIKARK